MDYRFDRFLRYDEMVEWLRAAESRSNGLLSLEVYGRSHLGRDLLLATVTDPSTGPAADKPAHWVDANIHAVEVTGGVAALALIDRLISGFGPDATVTEALRTRAFYIAPRVNPDGVEDALADQPRFHRSSVRPWPWTDGHRWPGLVPTDIDGDGVIRTMRIADPDGAWVEHPNDPRVMAPVPPDGQVGGRQRYRLLTEGVIEKYDGFTIDTPRDPAGLDLNRNFPAGWSTSVLGSGDHPLSEPEIDALVRAIRARPNICGYNAFHTSGGVLLRPSSTRSDGDLPAGDLWVWRRLAERGTELTGYRCHSVFEDFTWDRRHLMSGAADDWAYDHLGVFSWTTEFWDVVHHATGERASTHIWFEGPTVEQELSVARWSDEHAPGGYDGWKPFDHPQLGAVEIGGADDFRLWTNAPAGMLAAEVSPHADFAIHQALASPRLEISRIEVVALGEDLWRIRVGVSNSGWLPTEISAHARREHLVLPIRASLHRSDGTEATTVGGPATVRLGQLSGRAAMNLGGRPMSDGTPDRLVHEWTARGPIGSELTVEVSHQRAGRVTARIELS
ncbi:MAG: M14 family metallopeptidase [Ilumatobacteraceae bacterium]